MSEGAVEKLKEQRLRLQKRREEQQAELELTRRTRVADQISDITGRLSSTRLSGIDGMIEYNGTLFPETREVLVKAGFNVTQGSCDGDFYTIIKW